MKITIEKFGFIENQTFTVPDDYQRERKTDPSDRHLINLATLYAINGSKQQGPNRAKRSVVLKTPTITIIRSQRPDQLLVIKRSRTGRDEEYEDEEAQEVIDREFSRWKPIDIMARLEREFAMMGMAQRDALSEKFSLMNLDREGRV